MTDFVGHAENLNDAFHAWSSLYIQTHPPSERRASVNLGWKFWIIAVVCLAQILLAALRTAEVFYDAALISSGNSVLAISEAFLAILAVEVGMVVYAAIDAVRKNKTDEIGGAMLSIIIMLGISMAAGLLQSISIVVNIDPTLLKWLQYGVSISTGVGASFIAFIGGKYLGTQIVMRDAEQFEIDDEYKTVMEEYNASMLRSWQSSKEYKIARSGLQMPVQAQEPKLSETFGNFSVDWRNLAHQDKEAVYELSRVAVMDRFGVSDRTAYNWKYYADEMFGENGR